MASSKSCETCGKPLRLKIKGRKRRYCSNRCRSEARRNRHFVSLGYPDSAATQNDERNAAKTGISGAEKRDRALPQNIVGNGYRWLGRVERELVAEIIRREIGGMAIRAGACADPAANDNDQSQPKTRAA